MDSPPPLPFRIEYDKVACAVMTVTAGLMALLGGLLAWDPTIFAGTEEAVDDRAGRVIGLLCLAFFGACALAWGGNYFARHPALAFDADGFRVAQLVSSDPLFIPWPEVKEVRLRKQRRLRHVSVDLVRPERLLETGTWPDRLVRFWNKKVFGTPLHIATLSIDLTAEQLAAILRHHAGLEDV
ncbi:MAG: STM3941 family protein [Magnetovibrionaceae bacterium]